MIEIDEWFKPEKLLSLYRTYWLVAFVIVYLPSAIGPFFNSLWSGTGTVTVDPESCFCITTWLPLRRTSEKPCFSSNEITAFPERGLSFPNRYPNACNEDVPMGTCINFFWRSGLKEKL